jgi:pimeloyl-ACP methyl ester carboxylesterase
MPEVKIDGASIHYESRGSGPVLLMLLPQSSGPVGLDALLTGLVENHRVVTYHQRGTGRSSAWSEPMSMVDQAADAALVLEAAGAECAHIFCHSTGCGIGISLAASHVHLTTSLSLVNPWTWGDPHLTTMQNLRIAAARTLDPIHYSRFNAALLFPPEYRREHQAGFVRMAKDACRSPHNADDIQRRLESILAFDARTLLAQLDVPTLVVGARDDQLMPAWFAEEAAAIMSNAELELFDGGGHMLPETRTMRLLEVVSAHTLLVTSKLVAGSSVRPWR